MVGLSATLKPPPQARSQWSSAHPNHRKSCNTGLHTSRYTYQGLGFWYEPNMYILEITFWGSEQIKLKSLRLPSSKVYYFKTACLEYVQFCIEDTYFEVTHDKRSAPHSLSKNTMRIYEKRLTSYTCGPLYKLNLVTQKQNR